METEKQFDARMARLERDIKENHPEVIWVNAEQYAKQIRRSHAASTQAH